MATKSVKLGITLYNREYIVNCGPGEEARLQQIVDLIQREMETVAGKVGNMTEPRHLMLTCLSLADKLLESRNKSTFEFSKEEDLFIAAVAHLKQRVTDLASQVGRA
jgi:cell division protein ZapA (FtsZ GTPase activity inhibitor)